MERIDTDSLRIPICGTNASERARYALSNRDSDDREANANVAVYFRLTGPYNIFDTVEKTYSYEKHFESHAR